MTNSSTSTDTPPDQPRHRFRHPRGLLAAIGFIFTSSAINYAFEGRCLKLFLINGGYPLISYSVIGILVAT